MRAILRVSEGLFCGRRSVRPRPLPAVCFCNILRRYSRASAERTQQWDSDFEADFSEWTFLETMMGSAGPRLNEAKERAAAEFERRKQP